ncbi:hypothetical protein RUM44_009528 [Polyplax serrata]|uniref:BED-type domain-containing protein n=1 Tax=Polyplax serrata TaxID=468196 RepID=A0ABR1ATJ1_POLSC
MILRHCKDSDDSYTNNKKPSRQYTPKDVRKGLNRKCEAVDATGGFIIPQCLPTAGYLWCWSSTFRYLPCLIITLSHQKEEKSGPQKNHNTGLSRGRYSVVCLPTDFHFGPSTRWSSLRSPIWDFYVKYPDMSVCKTCGSVLRGSRINSNAKYHLKALHPELFDIFQEKRGEWLCRRKMRLNPSLVTLKKN